jgi:hypothetical protein
MSKPTVLPTWDTDVTNITVPSSALLEDGWPYDDIPTAANFNWLFYYITQWIDWMGNRFSPKVFPAAAMTLGVDWDQGAIPGYVASNGGPAATAELALPFEVGDRVKNLNIAYYGDAAADVVISLHRFTMAGVDTSLAERTLENPAASWDTTLVDFEADTGAMALSVDGSIPKNFTRAAGSFIDDGFAVDMTITTTGFANAGNNSTFVIDALTDTVLSVTVPGGLVTEVGSGDEQMVVSSIPTLGDGESFRILFSASAANIRIGNTKVGWDDGSAL